METDPEAHDHWLPVSGPHLHEGAGKPTLFEVKSSPLLCPPTVPPSQAFIWTLDPAPTPNPVSPQEHSHLPHPTAENGIPHQAPAPSAPVLSLSPRPPAFAVPRPGEPVRPDREPTAGLEVPRVFLQNDHSQQQLLMGGNCHAGEDVVKPAVWKEKGCHTPFHLDGETMVGATPSQSSLNMHPDPAPFPAIAPASQKREVVEYQEEVASVLGKRRRKAESDDKGEDSPVVEGDPECPPPLLQARMPSHSHQQERPHQEIYIPARRPIPALRHNHSHSRLLLPPQAPATRHKLKRAKSDIDLRTRDSITLFKQELEQHQQHSQPGLLFPGKAMAGYNTSTMTSYERFVAEGYRSPDPLTQSPDEDVSAIFPTPRSGTSTTFDTYPDSSPFPSGVAAQHHNPYYNSSSPAMTVHGHWATPGGDGSGGGGAVIRGSVVPGDYSCTPLASSYSSSSDIETGLSTYPTGYNQPLTYQTNPDGIGGGNSFAPHPPGPTDFVTPFPGTLPSQTEHVLPLNSNGGGGGGGGSYPYPNYPGSLPPQYPPSPSPSSTILSTRVLGPVYNVNNYHPQQQQQHAYNTDSHNAAIATELLLPLNAGGTCAILPTQDALTPRLQHYNTYWDSSQMETVPEPVPEAAPHHRRPSMRLVSGNGINPRATRLVPTPSTLSIASDCSSHGENPPPSSSTITGSRSSSNKHSKDVSSQRKKSTTSSSSRSTPREKKPTTSSKKESSRPKAEKSKTSSNSRKKLPSSPPKKGSSSSSGGTTKSETHYEGTQEPDLRNGMPAGGGSSHPSLKRERSISSSSSSEESLLQSQPSRSHRYRHRHSASTPHTQEQAPSHPSSRTRTSPPSRKKTSTTSSPSSTQSPSTKTNSSKGKAKAPHSGSSPIPTTETVLPIHPSQCLQPQDPSTTHYQYNEYPYQSDYPIPDPSFSSSSSSASATTTTETATQQFPPQTTTFPPQTSTIPPPPPQADTQSQRRLKDAYLVTQKRLGVPYKDIKRLGNFSEAEATLRGRYRALTKKKEERVRKPEWRASDITLLTHAVTHLYSSQPPSSAGTLCSPKISWKEVAAYISDNGGSYRFGYATCKKKWDDVAGEIAASGIVSGAASGASGGGGSGDHEAGEGSGWPEGAGSGYGYNNNDEYEDGGGDDDAEGE